MSFGTWSAPMAGSWIGLLIAGTLSYLGFFFLSREKRLPKDVQHA